MADLLEDLKLLRNAPCLHDEEYNNIYRFLKYYDIELPKQWKEPIAGVLQEHV